MNTAASGRRFENSIRDELREAGYLVVRSAGSFGPIDLVALRRREVLLIQAKVTDKFDPADWNALLDMAKEIGAVPILAVRKDRNGKPMDTWWRLVGRKKPHKRQLNIRKPYAIERRD